MADIRLSTDIRGQSLNTIMVDRVIAFGGSYVRSHSGPNHWVFVLDPVMRARVAQKTGKLPPPALPADDLVCWRFAPSRPMIGGFTHPVYNFYCRAASIPWGWDDAKIQLQAAVGMGQDSELSPDYVAGQVAIEINQKLDKRPWWLYTLPKVEKGQPVVVIGVKGDVPFPSPREMGSYPWELWKRRAFVRFDVVEPAASGMGEAAYNNEYCPICGAPAQGATRCIPSSAFCANGHSWNRDKSIHRPPSGMGQAQYGMPQTAARPDGLGSAPVDAVWATNSPDYHEPVGDGTSDDDLGIGGLNVEVSQLGQSSHGWAQSWRKGYASPRPVAPDGMVPPERFMGDQGMGSAPIMAMPSGMLNWDRVTGYEGQRWTEQVPPKWAPALARDVVEVEGMSGDEVSQQPAALVSAMSRKTKKWLAAAALAGALTGYWATRR